MSAFFLAVLCTFDIWSIRLHLIYQVVLKSLGQRFSNYFMSRTHTLIWICPQTPPSENMLWFVLLNCFKNIQNISPFYVSCFPMHSPSEAVLCQSPERQRLETLHSKPRWQQPLFCNLHCDCEYHSLIFLFYFNLLFLFYVLLTL